ncbi:MAG TPA: hypothetical protein VM223_26985 [Planctomycetota bacterium]|nr:hypothetical protein [Planctomycetota bacterium]
MNRPKTTEPVRLTWAEKDGTVLIEPEDEDRYSLTVEQVIEACQAYDPQKKVQVRKAFAHLLGKLAGWVNDHADKVDKAFLTRRYRNLLFLVIMKEKRHDEQLEDELSAIDLQIAREKQFADIRLCVLALPHCEAEDYLHFIDPEFYLMYRGPSAQ